MKGLNIMKNAYPVVLVPFHIGPVQNSLCARFGACAETHPFKQWDALGRFLLLRYGTGRNHGAQKYCQIFLTHTLVISYKVTEILPHRRLSE